MISPMSFTSGSTGKPKGVMVEHGNLMSFCSGIGEHIDFASADKMLAVTTISFDIFLLETIVPLTKGMTVVIATEQQQADPQVLKELILQEEITFLQLTPSRLQLMLEEKSNLHALDSLKAILIGGEALSKSLFQRLRTQTKARLYNLYGPTETTIWSTVQDLTEAEEVTIGAPLPNTQVYILDEHLQVQPMKINGDLYIAGDGVTRGYYGQPTLTAERYILIRFNLVNACTKQVISRDGCQTGVLNTWDDLTFSAKCAVIASNWVRLKLPFLSIRISRKQWSVCEIPPAILTWLPII